MCHLRASRSVARPRLKVLLASLRSTLRDGADRRRPDGAAVSTVWPTEGAAQRGSLQPSALVGALIKPKKS